MESLLVNACFVCVEPLSSAVHPLAPIPAMCWTDPLEIEILFFLKFFVLCLVIFFICVHCSPESFQVFPCYSICRWIKKNEKLLSLNRNLNCEFNMICYITIYHTNNSMIFMIPENAFGWMRLSFWLLLKLLRIIERTANKMRIRMFWPMLWREYLVLCGRMLVAFRGRPSEGK